MNRLDGVLTAHPLPTWRPIAWTIMGLVATLLVWANFAHLDEVAIAAGEVIPLGKVKVIQHLEGGIIEEIHVREGSVVEAGDLLVRLNLGTAGVNRDELRARLDGELLRRARLVAEVEEGDLALPEEPAKRFPALAQAERSAFDARRRELQSTLSVLAAQVEQKELQVEEQEARKKAVTSNLALARERFQLSTSLLAKGLTARIEHLELEAEVRSLEGELGTLTQSTPRARAAVAEAREKIVEARERFRREAQEELRTAENAIATLEELFAEATEQGSRAEIRSPIAGIVKNMRYNTIGGVVAPGEAIMEIVPTGDSLVIEARLSPTDRGYVQPGQRAVVKVSAYDFVRYGGLDGTVTHVSPDSITDRDGIPYFGVIVETDKTYLGKEEGSLPITPGMQATAEVHTGTRSVMHYLIKPVLKLRDEAFRER